MRYLFILFIALGFLFSCGTRSNSTDLVRKDSLPEFSYASIEAHAFVNNWILLQNRKKLGGNCTDKWLGSFRII
jgi:hypothetical protein